ncbi:lipoprotein insertase outer membrane protein LolB [Grimontia hollisae]|uniref:Outer-membrane lipoprotein LolB n=1 Tax=Grimontia hollisae TaxID=673 RepID=A0A377HPW1_GRIHO|nr:lipoprotein insertase outer membrane protein LolB [Grimontia hollisae]STO58176.1 Outer-membrane lipoprotein lolB precursor [Grimontia hollisae]
MFRHHHLLVLFLLTLVGMTGCSTQPIPQTEWQTHQAMLSAITRFTAKGKVALISPEQRVSAHFVWEQEGDKLSLRLSNFLGSTLFKLDATPDAAVLVDGDGKRYVDRNAASLLKRLTGIALPVDEMMRWVKGLPAEQNAYTLGADNRLASLSENKTNTLQKGWQLDYTDYDADTNNLLPSKIKMTLNQQKVNLVISEWVYPQ